MIPTVTKLERKIITYHKNFLKIKEFGGVQWEELGKRIDVMSMGIQKEPIPAPRMVLIIDILKNKFSDFGINEIIEAFSMAFAREIEVDKTYGNLTVEWIASVLAAYRKYRNKHIALFEKEKDKEESIKNEEMVYTDEAYYISLLKYIKEEKQIPETWQYDAVFRYLEDSGEVKINNDEKQMYADNIKADLQEEKDAALDKKEHAGIGSILDNPDKFKKECRRRFCINHFKNK